MSSEARPSPPLPLARSALRSFPLSLPSHPTFLSGQTFFFTTRSLHDFYREDNDQTLNLASCSTRFSEPAFLRQKSRRRGLPSA